MKPVWWLWSIQNTDSLIMFYSNFKPWWVNYVINATVDDYVTVDNYVAIDGYVTVDSNITVDCYVTVDDDVTVNDCVTFDNYVTVDIFRVIWTNGWKLFDNLPNLTQWCSLKTTIICNK